MDCPGEEQLVELAGGSITAVERAAVEAHLAGCAVCRQIVAEVGRARSP
jgi:anti-sigma factor RsiW